MNAWLMEESAAMRMKSRFLKSLSSWLAWKMAIMKRLRSLIEEEEVDMASRKLSVRVEGGDLDHMSDSIQSRDSKQSLYYGYKLPIFWG